MKTRRISRLLQQFPVWFRRIPDFTIRRKRHRCLAAVGALLLAGTSLPWLHYLRSETTLQLLEAQTLTRPLLEHLPLPSIQLHQGQAWYLVRSTRQIYRLHPVSV